jgi:hypothetical protein
MPPIWPFHDLTQHLPINMAFPTQQLLYGARPSVWSSPGASCDNYWHICIRPSVWSLVLEYASFQQILGYLFPRPPPALTKVYLRKVASAQLSESLLELCNACPRARLPVPCHILIASLLWFLLVASLLCLLLMASFMCLLLWPPSCASFLWLPSCAPSYGLPLVGSFMWPPQLELPALPSLFTHSIAPGPAISSPPPSCFGLSFFS